MKINRKLTVQQLPFSPSFRSINQLREDENYAGIIRVGNWNRNSSTFIIPNCDQFKLFWPCKVNFRTRTLLISLAQL